MIGPISRDDLIGRLKRLGWIGPFAGGKHAHMIKGPQRLKIPNTHGRDIGVPLLRALLKQAGISETAWNSVR